MRRFRLVIAVVAVLVLGFVLLIVLPLQIAVATPFTQAAIVTEAVAYANTVGLQGVPTNVQAKQMTLGEFSARLDPFGNYAGSENTVIWLVVMKGNVASRNPPGQNGKITTTNYDNLWVAISARGEVMGWGAQASGNELNLDAPPQRMKAFPTSADPNK